MFLFPLRIQSVLICSALCLMGALPSVSFSQESVELLSNADFQTVEGNHPVGFNYEGWVGGSSINRYGITKEDGMHFVRLTIPPETEESSHLAIRTMPPTEVTSNWVLLKVASKIRLANFTPSSNEKNGAKLFVSVFKASDFLEDSGSREFLATLDQDSDGWITLEAEFSVPPDAVALGIGVALYGASGQLDVASVSAKLME